jgi:sensor domain CHASE-containing protein
MSMSKRIGYDLDDILHLVNLQRRRSMTAVVVPAALFMVLGAALGAGLGLVLAPSSGRRLRQEVGDRLDQIREHVKTEVNATAHS